MLRKIWVYTLFLEEYNNYVSPLADLEDGVGHINFDGACSNDGNRAGIVLYSLVGKIHNFSYKLEFACTDNVT